MSNRLGENIMDYSNTPSFYNNEDFFNRYLGKTSYYLGLQNVVDKLISATSAQKVLELGSALGTTMLLMAEKYPEISFVGLDMREDIILQARKKSKSNTQFITADMCKYVENSLYEYDMIYMLYSFHHIQDPLDQKEKFLRNCFENMKKGAYLLIAETFLPENIVGDKNDNMIIDLFKQRSLEGYASSFWESFTSLSDENLAMSKSVAESSANEESTAGKMVFDRDSEYLVKFNWLKQICNELGFNIVLAEPVNCIMENVILLRR